MNPVINPGKGPQRDGSPKKFWAVYTKLMVFQLVEYSKGGWALNPHLKPQSLHHRPTVLNPHLEPQGLHHSPKP